MNELGLMVWSSDGGLVDVIGAGHNTYKAGKSRAVRKIVMKLLEKKEPL